MGIIEIVLLGISLSMDALAVSICKGLSMKKWNLKKATIIGLYFGVFQALMPAVGYFLGSTLEGFISGIDHWIIFVLLSVIGGNMIREALDKNKEDNSNDDVGFKTMIMLAVATSIDAFAVGITFAFLNVNILFAIFVIGFITFFLSFLGVIVGNKFGSKYENKATIVGGIVLILIGIKVLLEHLNIL